MPDNASDICLRIRVLNPQGQRVSGTADIELKPRLAGQAVSMKGNDISQDIDVGGLLRGPRGVYEVSVTAAGVVKPPTKAVTIPTTGYDTVEFVIEASVVLVQYVLKGSLVFDNGLAAAGIVTRLYNIGFAGQDTKLGEVTSDGAGNYSISYALAKGVAANIQVRVPDTTGKQEVTISNTKFTAQTSETLNLVVPSSVQPLTPEYSRLAVDMERSIGGIAKLGQAQEGSVRQDLTLLNQSTNWDARLVALAASAGQLASTTGIGQDALYALLRVGLPTDPSLLAVVPSDTVKSALAEANQSGVVTLNEQQIAATVTAFQAFATKTQMAMKAPGAVSNFGDLLSATLGESNQKAPFANLYLTQPMSADFWSQAAKLNIPAQTLDQLKLQGKFLYLTFNNNQLAQQLQKEVGTVSQISQIVNKDYHRAETWQSTLTALAGTGGDQALNALIPSIYPGNTTADRLVAYSADLARKVRISFPTEVTARMIETKDIPLSENTAANVTAFLRAASPLGYRLGRTPLNAYLQKLPAGVPQLDAESTKSLKTVHRLYQVTPSFESLQAAVGAGLRSGNQIATYKKEDFIEKYGDVFPEGEAEIIFSQAQTVQSVTFNVFSTAQGLDTNVPTPVTSGTSDQRQSAKSAIVQQFPSMASLFGNLDFCNCEDCKSVLSPAAYFVDVLNFLGNSGTNLHGYTPLDVLIGKDATVTGRRPDLGALPLTCENTNTSMPYIDLVNEILEYYIANSHLDGNAAYDTGTATTADLTAEPQHILPTVYSNQLKKAVYPLNLPFDLWIETVRGFLNYFQMPLAQVLEVLRPADTLELFTDAHNYPYYRAQIVSEALGLSPSEYGVLAVLDPATQNPSVQNWFELYGYPDEPTALSELTSAKTLSQQLGLTYQDVADLVTTGFLNPGLYPLIFQFQRFGIELSDALSYTGAPGPLTDLLANITAQYTGKNSASTFKGQTWLTTLVPPGYAKKVLVLADPDSGCDFSDTTLQYADGSAATPLDFLKFNLFTRLWKKLGWSLDETDRAMQLFFPANLPAWGDPNFATSFSSSWKTALVYLAHLEDLNTQLAPAMGRTALLPFLSNLPVQGENPLYAQLFLTASVLNSDWAFDDPYGLFPTQLTDFAATPANLNTLAAHQPTIQGVLGLTADEITAILADAGPAVTTVTVVIGGNNVTVPSFTLTNLSICYRYSALAKCLQISVSDMIALKAMSGLNPFQGLGTNPISVLSDDILYNQMLPFVKQVAAVQNSGFTVEDLQYLLRQQFDPVGKYQIDPNALIALVQTLAEGLQQIQTQNAVPANLMSMAESLIDQILSSLFPTTILKNLFSLLTNSQGYTASQGGVAAGTQIDPTPFAQEPEISFNYDPVSDTQSVTYKGLLTEWKKAQLELINTTPLFSALLDQVQATAQQALAQRVGDLLGVWASLVEYEAVETGVATPLPADTLMAVDSALSLSYDQAEQLQWLGYRGVLTDEKRTALSAVALSPALTTLLSNLMDMIQAQTPPAYKLLLGSLLAIWVNGQTYESTRPSATAIDPVAFAQAISDAQQAGTVTGPAPVFAFSYDPVGQQQTIVCTGVLLDTVRAQIGTLAVATPLLNNLLQDVRNQAVQEFQTLATGILTVLAADLDTYAEPLVGLDATKQQKQIKAQLVEAFLPLLSGKLSQQFVLQTLSSTLASVPGLTAALVTDAGLLSDPTTSGRSLLATFLALGQQGVSASYFSSTDGSGTAKATGVAATTDTADLTNSTPPTASAHFEGYLQVTTDGPYRFFAELGDAGAGALFQLDSPDPTALFSNPIISPTPPAAAAGAEVSQFVQLKGGVAYHFTLDFSNLGTNGAKLLVQGETLPKGPLSQIMLYPEQSVDNFARAKTLLAKVLQIVQVMALDEREISYLVAHADQFSGLDLSRLPTQASDDSPANAAKLFAQFLTLADYADLRKGPAGGTDGLVDVFEAAQQTAPQEPNTPWTLLANLTRRDSQVVQDVAAALGSDPHFANNVGIRRIWNALQLVQIVGIPMASLAASTLIVSPQAPTTPSPDQIAANFKNAVQAQYTVDAWRPIAQSVFDKLRQKKRDALVAYLVQELNLENSEQLFEYFLVDPGMEPVVQTSRLRLAMSSLQTFVQRCLMNLENANSNATLNVSPNALDADSWEWMKRYRVWEANREIFLFPENWMDPELRLDKSDLFQALESTLLQGDVTSDLVEDALMTYLKGLDVRARLDIVATYLDQAATANDVSTLHVLGRTYSHPHKYFYRTYSNGTWASWNAVGPDIDGDHIVLAIWRGRLNVFWVTFLSQQQGPAPDSNNQSGPVGGLNFGALASDIFSGAPQQLYKLQLHWMEYFQSKWSNPIATDVSKSRAIAVEAGFDPLSVYIRVSTEVADDGSEGAVDIHLDFPSGQVDDPQYENALFHHFHDHGHHISGPSPQPTYVFRVTSKNCDPTLMNDFFNLAPTNPYVTTGIEATLRTGGTNLTAQFTSGIASDGTSTTDTEPILQTVNSFAVLECGNPVVPPSGFLGQNEPLLQEAGSLVSPFFYRDSADANTNNELTFFVQPTLTETTILEWEWWAIPSSAPSLNYPNVIGQINVIAQVPTAGPVPINPGDPEYSVYAIQDTTDWLTNPATAVQYGTAVIGQNGGINDFETNAAVAGGGIAVIGKAGVTPSHLSLIGAGPGAKTRVGAAMLARRKS